MKPYTGRIDSNGPAYPDLILMQLESAKKNTPDDIDSGVFKGKDLAVDAGGSNPSWVVALDDLSIAYRMPPGEKEEQDLLHLARSGAASVYIEAPFGSYRPLNRLAVVQAMSAGSVPLYFLDTKYSTRELRNQLGLKGPKNGDNGGWTNAEAALSCARYALKKIEQGAGVLTPTTVERFTRDHSERNARRTGVSLKLKDLRREGTQEYEGHAQRVAELTGKFRTPGLEPIALSSQVCLATLYTVAEGCIDNYDAIDDFMPREGAYRIPGKDQGGIVRSNLAIHCKQHSLKDLRRTCRAIRAILLEQAGGIPNGLS